MFWGQSWIYQEGILFVGKPSLVTRWLASDYTLSALIVFFTCLVATLVWIVFTSLSSFYGAKEVDRSRIVWWLLGLLPVASIGITVFWLNRLPSAQASLLGFFVLDELLLYWLPTATSSPESVKYIPPGSAFIRHQLMGD